MRFRIEQHYDAPPEAVEAAYLDAALLDRLGELPKLGRPALVGRRDQGDLVHQEIRYRFVGELNAAVRKVVDPARLTWIEDSTLDRSTHVTTWRIVPDHYGNLIRSSGTFCLEPDGEGGTRRVTEAEMKVSVPLLGGRVEQAIVSGLREHAEGEAQVVAALLAGR